MQRHPARRRERSFRWESGFRSDSATVIRDITGTDIPFTIPTDITRRTGRIIQSGIGIIIDGLIIGTVAIGFTMVVASATGNTANTAAKNLS